MHVFCKQTRTKTNVIILNYLSNLNIRNVDSYGIRTYCRPAQELGCAGDIPQHSGDQGVQGRQGGSEQGQVHVRPPRPAAAAPLLPGQVWLAAR